MPRQLDKIAAARHGDLVNTVYAIYADDPTLLQPEAAKTSFGSLWQLLGWIDMKDFILGFTTPKFYGVVLKSTDPTKTDGYEYAIAIRGTEGLLEWFDDAMALPVPFDPVPSGRVAYGFNHIYSTLNVTHVATGQRPQVADLAPQTFAEQIDALVLQSTGQTFRAQADTGEPAGKFLVTAHSLGAALATLYVMENVGRNTVQVDTICTFASPRVGWASFVSTFNALQQSADLTTWRFTNVNDVVTMVPPKLLGYRDVDDGTEFSGFQFSKHDLGCMHNMTIYQHFLDASNYPVPAACALSGVQAQALAQTSPAPSQIPDSKVTTLDGVAAPQVTVTIDVAQIAHLMR